MTLSFQGPKLIPASPEWIQERRRWASLTGYGRSCEGCLMPPRWSWELFLSSWPSFVSLKTLDFYTLLTSFKVAAHHDAIFTFLPTVVVLLMVVLSCVSCCCRKTRTKGTDIWVLSRQTDVRDISASNSASHRACWLALEEPNPWTTKNLTVKEAGPDRLPSTHATELSGESAFLEASQHALYEATTVH